MSHGVTVTSFHALSTIPAAFGTLLPADFSSTEALLVEVLAEASISDPVRIRWSDVQASSVRTLILVEADAKCTIVEEIDSAHPSHGIEVIVADGADVTIITADLSTFSKRNRSLRGQVGANAHLRWHGADLSSGMTTLHNRLAGAAAECPVEWMFLAKKTMRRQVDVQTTFDAPRGGGEIVIRGIAQDRARASARGLIAIGPDGGGTHTHLTEEVLMLDPTAHVDALPALEIKTNDVRASHSATVRRLREEDLFYFASRGISRTEARSMLIAGFLGSIVDRIPDSRLQDAIRARTGMQI